MAEKPKIPDFPTLPDFGQMITQACEVVASVRGIPYDFNGTLSLENKFVVLFKTVKEMFTAQDELVKSYKDLYDFINNYFDNLDVQEEVNKKVDELAKDGTLLQLIKPYIVNNANPIMVNSTSMMNDSNKIYVLSNNMHIYYWNGTTFTDSGNIYGISDNLHGHGLLFYSLESTPAEFRDLNNLLPNTVYWYAFRNGINNTPVSDFAGAVITFSYSNSAKAIAQLAISYENVLYYRLYQAAKWTSWNIPIENYMHGYGRLFYSLESTPAEFRDLNNLLPNTVYWYAFRNGINNTPVSDFAGAVITFSYSSSAKAMAQLAISYENVLYYRLYQANKWTSWATVNNNKTYYVGFPEHVNNYNSVIECLNAVKNDNEHKTIYIKSGTYDLLAEIGGMSYINSATGNWDEVQPVVSNVDIIGVGNVVLNFKLETTDYSHWWLFSALNVRGNVKLENITINSAKCRYSIHDESGTLYPDSVKKYINVKCYQDNTDYGGACVGCGYSMNTISTFINCVFQNTKTNAFSVHENGNCQLQFENCILTCGDDDYALRLSQVGYNYLYAYISNCFVTGLNIRDEIKDSTDNGNTEIKLINTYHKKFLSEYPKNESKVISYNYTGDITEL